LKKLGCLLVVIVIAVVAIWAYKAGWVRFGRPSDETRAVVTQTWQPLTTDGASRASAALQQLASSRGPVYVNVAPGDLAAYIFQQLTSVFPKDADSIQAAAIGDRLYVRAIVATRGLAGTGALGPLTALLGERERVQLGGTLHIIRPELAPAGLPLKTPPYIGDARVSDGKITLYKTPQPR